ncbi:MAG: hypothetical protein HYW85_02430 [Deltaproteobacteria bacterium]|nr:hypothetical protein [Deltaproteobacteria bacterium]MBI3017496.1 hypothetical protein [Deltaproteobacteria bacterium]
MYSEKDMGDLEHIEFRALDEGLGIHPSAFKTTRAMQKKEPLPLLDSTSSYTFLAFLFDELFVLFFFGLLCGISSWQLNIQSLQAWISFVSQGTILFFHFLLFMMISLFYFLFFNQFKTPSLGELFTRRVHTDF